MPNTIKIKAISLPLNFHLEKTYPFRDPRTTEMIVPTIVRNKLLTRPCFKLLYATLNPSQYKMRGGNHAWRKEISAGGFRAVITVI